MTLNQLIKGCKKADRRCQRQLYERLYDRAINTSLRYARDKPEARDIVQNAFITLFSKIEKFDPSKGDFEGWFFRIIINEALMLYRKRRSIHPASDQLHLLDDEIEPAILDHLHAQDILKLIRQLPDGYRLVFNLHIIEGYKHEEIAQRLGISPSTSRSQLSRAKIMLKHLINKQNA
ncbi:MAG: sigma-70 family RNA polymerase sigma factor [Bacteroidota bacterium]